MRRALPLLALGCGPRPAIGVTPDEVPLDAYVPVTFDLAELDVVAEDVDRIVVGGVAAYDLVPDGHDRLVATVQGAPASGPQVVELHVRDEVLAFDDALTYTPPIHEAFGTVVAMGASITQGVQGGVPTHHAILHSPPRLIARALGAYHPVPLLVDPLFPTIGWDDVGPAPACAVPSTVSHVTRAAIDVIASLEDEEHDRIGFYLGRVDPDVRPYDVAVGDSNVANLVHGPPDDLARQFLVKLVYAPYASIEEDVDVTQLELVEALEPDVVVVTDTYGNDLIHSIMLGSRIDADDLTPLDAFEADLRELLDRLAATGAQVFVANIPRATVLPATAEKRAQAIADASDPEAKAAEVDAEIAEIAAHGVAYGELLDTLAAEHDNVHVVDFRGLVDRVLEEGVDVDGVHLTVEKFGGLLSTDGVHLGDVGNGLVAQLFLDRIAEVYGVEPPPVDLSALLAGDPYSPAAAEAAGFDRSACALPTLGE